MAPQVHTVLGPIAPEALGVVDMHEHVRFGGEGEMACGLSSSVGRAKHEPSAKEIENSSICSRKPGGGRICSLPKPVPW